MMLCLKGGGNWEIPAMYMKRFKGYIIKQNLTTENNLSRGSGLVSKEVKYKIISRKKLWRIPDNF